MDANPAADRAITISLKLSPIELDALKGMVANGEGKSVSDVIRKVLRRSLYRGRTRLDVEEAAKLWWLTHTPRRISQDDEEE